MSNIDHEIKTSLWQLSAELDKSVQNLDEFCKRVLKGRMVKIVANSSLSSRNSFKILELITLDRQLLLRLDGIEGCELVRVNEVEFLEPEP